MKLKNKTKSILSAFLAVCMLLSISPVTTFAAQSNEYVDPADNWLSSNNRTNELDVNATTTYETQFCCVCNMQTTVLTYRVPEYTRSGETALNRDVRYSDGTCLDEERKGNLDSGTPGIDAYYTGYHWTKAVCQNCGTINSGDGMATYSFNNNVYSLNPCDNNFFLQFDNTTHEKYDDEYHLTTLKRGEYCKFCKGTYARATRGLADHNFTEQVDGQVANNRFYIAETCDDCGYETSEYVTAKAVVSSYYGIEDGEAHTLTVSDLSDSGVKTSIRYGTDADNCNKTSAPNYTQPGYYTVYYKINYSYSGESMIENGVSYVHILADESDEGGSNTIIVVPPAHEHDFRYLETVPASCENLGYELWQCDGCGELQKMNYSPAKGHKYEDISIREATCKQGGLKLSLCKDCGDFHQETTPTGNHNYHTTTHNATCRSVGYTDHTCEVCGDNFVTDIKPLISHAYEHITKEPDCDEKGYTTSTCVMCGSSYVSDYTEPTGHNWDEGTSVTSSTCEADGVIEYVCQNEDCGEKMIKADAATGHTPGEAATCTEPQICTVCETVLELPTGHNHSESVIAPTCETMGYSVFTCDCGDTYTANFTDKAEHEYETEITEPTCVSMGHTHYDCVNCDYEFDADYTDKLPHNYKADVTAPSCSAFGFTVYTCECGDTYTSDYTDKTEHNYNKQVVEPTCEEHGYAVYECPDCGASYIGDYTENKEHIYKETVIAPSCTEMGYTIFTCDCGDTYKGNYTDKIPHNYEKKVTPATCEEMGYTVYDCKNCDDTYTSDYTDIIPHNYKSEIKAATCVSLGFTTFVCEDCGHTYKAEYVEPKGHTPSDWIIDVPATITSGGSKHVECSVCGETLQTAEIAQLIDADRTDEDGAAEVGDFSIILTDKNGTPIFNSEIVIDVDNKISIKLPNGRLLDYADQTTITAFFTENQEPAADLNIFIEDKNGNNATSTTDANGQLKVPNNQSSTGDDNGTIGNENNEVKNTYVVSVTDKYNVIIPNCDIKIGESNNVVVDLPDGLILTKDSPAIITITNQNGEPQKDVSVIVIADKDYIEKGLTDRYGKLTVPPVNSGYTDKDGKVNVNGFNVIVNDEAKQIENAFVTLNDDNTISVLLPAENLIDYSNRICVTVLDKDGAAVKDMTVKVIDVTENNRSGVTDENGKMVVPPLSEDKTDKDGKATVNGLNILVTDEKAAIENAFVTIADGKINIELPADKVIDIANRIIVTVTDSENKAVKDMSVTVKDNTERTETNLTDADGKAVIPPTTFDITDVNGYGELTGFEIVVTDESKVIENASLTLNEDNSISVVLPAETLIAHSNRITVIVTNKADKTPAKNISVTVCEAPKTETEETAKSVSGKTDADGKIVVPPLSEDITDNEGNSGVTDKEEKPGEDTDGDGKEDKPGETVTTLYKVALNDTKGVITDAFVKIEDGKVYITLPETHTLTTSNQITATITDNDGKAVKGVSVTIADKTTSKTGTTDANGKVTLPVKSSGGGGGSSRPSSSGGGGGGGSYVSTTVKIVDKDGKTVSVSKSVSTTKATLTLPTGKKLTDDNYYTITVTSSGKAKADYTVVLKDRSGNEITGTTDANGVVMLPGKKHSAYIFGYPDSTFRPDGDMTRSEAAAIFARLIAEEKGEKISGTSTDFKDISKKAWYASYVSYLEKYGIIKGYTDNTFRPDNKVTRAEFIAMTVRYYDLFNDVKYVLFFWLGDKLGYSLRVFEGNKISALMKGIAELFKSPLFSFNPIDMLIGVVTAVAIKGILYIRSKNAKKFRKGIEYGSARWGTAEDIKPYMDAEFQNNILLTNTERLTMSSRPKNPKHARNKNVLVIGGSGSGKTRFFIKPNLMQLHSSYVVTDPKGTVLIECGRLLEKAGYEIKSLNTINFKKSMHYNPFAYIKDEKDILKLVSTIIANTKGEGEKASEDFWVKAERLYYSALIAYIWYEAPEEEKNFITLLDMINASEAREDDENFKSPVDLLFERLEEKDAEHFAVKQYKKYKLAAGKTAKSILISCGARLAPFDIKELRALMEYDELELDTLGDKKTALFIITSDLDNTFDFITAMVISQMFNILCAKADDEYGGRLPIHVRCLLDEAANITIPMLQRLIAVIRSREISACIVLQAQSQLKAIYKDNADTIIGNCDCTLFLGGKEKSTLKEISETLGKETIDLYNTSETRSNQNSYGLNYQKLGKELMSQDELAVMDGGKCILQLRGVRPFLSDKYDITKHPNYKYTSDAKKKNAFDIEKYMKRKQRRAKIKPDEAFELYKVDMPEEKQESVEN